MDISREAVSFNHAHTNSQRLWQHTQGLHRFEPEGVPVLRGGSGHNFPPLAEKLGEIDTCWQRETQIFFNRVSLYYQLYSSIENLPKSCWQNQNELNCMLVKFLLNFNFTFVLALLTQLFFCLF